MSYKVEKKRVLIIAANGMGNSGVPNVYMQIIRNLSDKCVFDLVITRADYYFKNEFLSFGGRLYLFEQKLLTNKLKRIFWRIFGASNYIKKKMAEIFKNKKYDIIHSFKESESWMYLKIAKKYGVKNRIIHNNRQKDNYKSIFSKLFIHLAIKKSLKYSTNNISVSNDAGRSFFGKAQFEIVHNTFDEKTFYFRESKNYQDYPFLLQIGTFLPVKNQLFSLDVLSILKTTFPRIKMLFVGKPYDSVYYSAFTKKIESLNLSENIIIQNDFEKKQDILDNVTYTLMPSIKEGLPLVAIESQSVGIKVFASKGVPNEINAGNVEFNELNQNLWASNIVEDFKKNFNKRKLVSMDNFSLEKFINCFIKLYSLI